MKLVRLLDDRPARGYEMGEVGCEAKFVINVQNSVHYKSCDLENPSRTFHWTVPQGGDGPNDPNM